MILSGRGRDPLAALHNGDLFTVGYLVIDIKRNSVAFCNPGRYLHQMAVVASDGDVLPAAVARNASSRILM